MLNQELKREACVRYIFKVVLKKMIFKIIRLDEITKGVAIDREKENFNGQVL